MSLAHGILGFLNYGNMSGYDLAKAFDSSIQFFWHAQNSQIYLVLENLEKKGFVTHERIVQADKPNKKLYSITASGKKEFIRWLTENDSGAAVDFKSAFLMKVFFSGNTMPEQSIEMLKRFISDCHSFIDSMEIIPNAIAEYSKAVPLSAAAYWQFTADFGYRYVEMCIEWAESCIEKLEGML